MRTLPSPRPAHYPPPPAGLRCGCRRRGATSALRAARQARGLTLRQLAAQVGVPCAGLLSRWEYGDVRPRPATGKRLAEALGLPLAAIYGDGA